MNQELEKREYTRAEKPFVLRLRIKPENDHKATSVGWNMVSANNLSAGGVFLYYVKELEIGTLVELKISIPESTTSIYCVGETIRTSKQPKSQIYEIAISFKEIENKERELINKLINEDS